VRTLAHRAVAPGAQAVAAPAPVFDYDHAACPPATPVSIATWYPTIKHLHMTCAAATLALFVLRGVWMMRGSPLLAARWVRVLPHVVDTLLLASAITLAVIIGNAPLTHGWLTAKVIGLILYIVLGTIALKRGRTRGVRIGAFVGALVVFGYIVSVAVTKSPLGYLALIA